MIHWPFVKSQVSARGLVRLSFLVPALVCITAAGSYAQKRSESVRGPSVASRAPNYDAPPSEFAAPEACKDCHKNEPLEYEKPSHSEITFPSKNYIHGC